MRVGYVKADAQATRHFPVNLAVTSEDNITFTPFAPEKKQSSLLSKELSTAHFLIEVWWAFLSSLQVYQSWRETE